MTLRPAIFAAVVVVLAASGSGDYELVIPGIDPSICAKGARVCVEAQEAIRAGRGPIIDQDTPTGCEPAPNCFDPASNTVQGR